MNKTAKRKPKAKGVDQFDRLSVAERIFLVQRIWDGIAQDAAKLELTKAQKSELDRCLEEYYSDPKGGQSWEEVKAEILRDL